MPKDKSSSTFSNKSRDLFYKPYSTSPRGSSPKQQPEDTAEWEDLTCPICMESPHNAVLLLCSSSDKGCRPFMCDTSYRHANCLDQYIKAHAKAQSSSNASVHTVFSSGGDSHLSAARAARGGGAPADISGHVEMYKTCKGLELVCPLCRGKVSGWKVVDKARQQLNFKRRGCAHDSCTFVGAYEQLRKHARYIHPYARPSEVDPARQRDWWRLESQRDLGDVFSTIQSAMPGATIVGDYVIEEGDEEDEERDEEHEHEFDVDHEHDEDEEDEDEEHFHEEMVLSNAGGGDGGGGVGSSGTGAGAGGSTIAGVDRSLWTMLFLFRVFGGSSSSRDRHSSSSGSSTSHHQSHRSHHSQQHHHRASSGSSHYQQRHLAPVPRSYRGGANSRALSPFFHHGGGGPSSSSSSRAAAMDRNRMSSSSSSSSSRNRRRSYG